MQIKGNKIKVVPNKTELEKRLNSEFMPYIRISGSIPREVIKRFLKGLDLVAEEKHNQAVIELTN